MMTRDVHAFSNYGRSSSTSTTTTGEYKQGQLLLGINSASDGGHGHGYCRNGPHQWSLITNDLPEPNNNLNNNVHVQIAQSYVGSNNGPAPNNKGQLLQPQNQPMNLNNSNQVLLPPYITTTTNHLLYSTTMNPQHQQHYVVSSGGSSTGYSGSGNHYPSASSIPINLIPNGLNSSYSMDQQPTLPLPSHRHRETIHSGHFMVSDFEPESEALDEEYEVGMPIPPNPQPKNDNDDDEDLESDEQQARSLPSNSSANPPPPPTLPPKSRGQGVSVITNVNHTSSSKNNSINNSSSSTTNFPNNTNSSNNSNRVQTITSGSTKKKKDSKGRSGVRVISSETGVLVQRRDGSEDPSISKTVSIAAQPHALNVPISIDGSLTKLFQCMSLAYRQKLTSPKWNAFKGVRLRWKDKIRLNNVIWRCWHMQFILKQKALICQFASPLDVDQHNKPEAVVMEGKYWKRKLSTVAAEYKKWRLFFRNRIMGWTHHHPLPDLHPVSLDGFNWDRPGNFGAGSIGSFIFDDDLLMDFSDTLFSNLTPSQPFPFPNPRELSRAGMVADFIQPGLVQLQPNLEDFMDTLEPLQDFVSTSKLLAPVPEEEDYSNPTNQMLQQQAQQIQDSFGPSADLPSIIQNRMQQNLLLKQQQQQQQASSAAASSLGMIVNQNNYVQQQQQQVMYYTHQQQNSAITPVTIVDIQQHQPSQTQASSNAKNSQLHSHNQNLYHHHQQQHPHHSQHYPSSGSSGSGRGSSASGIGTGGANGHFAVPKGKPRGRSRSGVQNNNINSGPGRPGHSSTTGSLNSSSSSGPGSSSSSANVSLLTHLLRSNSPSTSSSSTSGSGNVHSLPSLPSLTTGLNNLPPWNPKHANETLNPNLPLDFGTKAQRGASSSSPPLLTTASTPSPPLTGSSSNREHSTTSGRPSSPSKVQNQAFRPKNDTDREHRRVCHINAEQKRRCNIKNGFDTLHSLIPALSLNPNAKVSKAAMLQKGSEYIRQLKSERAQLKEEIEAHRLQVESLNSAINNCQSLLPATGAPVSRQRTNKMKEMFDNWVRIRTLENWKFWIFSILIRPLLDSYNSAVSTSSLDEMCRTVLAWIDQHCSLTDLRPGVLNSLRSLCTTTDILTNPANLPEEAYRAVNRNSGESGSLDSTDSNESVIGPGR